MAETVYNTDIALITSSVTSLSRVALILGGNTDPR